MRDVRSGVGKWEMTTISDIANKSNRKLYMNHLSSLAKLREARLRIEELEAALREVISVSDRKTDIYDRAKAALGGKKDEQT